MKHVSVFAILFFAGQIAQASLYNAKVQCRLAGPTSTGTVEIPDQPMDWQVQQIDSYYCELRTANPIVLEFWGQKYAGNFEPARFPMAPSTTCQEKIQAEGFSVVDVYQSLYVKNESGFRARLSAPWSFKEQLERPNEICGFSECCQILY